MLPLFNTARREPTRLSRACALALIWLVLLLAVMAASPAAHHWLHADAGHEDHECAITLYAQGITTTAAILALAVVTWRLLGLSLDVRDELFLAIPRYLHVPGRAPPLG